MTHFVIRTKYIYILLQMYEGAPAQNCHHSDIVQRHVIKSYVLNIA